MATKDIEEEEEEAEEEEEEEAEEGAVVKKTTKNAEKQLNETMEGASRGKGHCRHSGAPHGGRPFCTVGSGTR